jgi:hypothetical protein
MAVSRYRSRRRLPWRRPKLRTERAIDLAIKREALRTAQSRRHQSWLCHLSGLVFSGISAYAMLHGHTATASDIGGAFSFAVGFLVHSPTRGG